MEPLTSSDLVDIMTGYGTQDPHTNLNPHSNAAHVSGDHAEETSFSSDLDSPTIIVTTSDPIRPTELPVTKDDTDFGISGTHGSDRSTRKERIQSLPRLKLPVMVQSPILGSPDSDGDILGYLDHTPDALGDTTDNGGTLSYFNLYNVTRFSKLMPNVFIRNQPVQLRITKVEPVHSHINLFNNHMISIDLEHGDFKWSVKKKVMQVASLHKELLILRTKIRLPAATREARQRRQSMRVQMKEAESEDTVDNTQRPANTRLLKYPRRALQTMDESVQTELETYLRNLLHHSLFRNHQDVLDFFEISPVSFISELGEKIKEGYVKKKIGGHSPNTCCIWCSSPCTDRYKQRWLVLKETCVFFLAPETGEVRNVMLMDTGFQVSHAYRLLGIRKGLLLSNLSRSMVIKCDTEVFRKEWHSKITETYQKQAKDFTSQDIRYGSFAPVRTNSHACWYVDGARYMWDVANMLEAAKEEIFITDWWMSPEIYLKRPDLTGSQWRLGEILRRQAARGVRVFILLYKEVELALGISSIWTKQTLNQMHPNIKILRHPDHYAGGVLYWAHHEKMVIVDQTYAFISGIDLAFGRWDDYRHKLVDVGYTSIAQPNVARPAAIGSALQQLVRGTNQVFVDTVTKSTPSSRRTSLDESFCADQTQSTIVSSVQLSSDEVPSTSPTTEGMPKKSKDVIKKGDTMQLFPNIERSIKDSSMDHIDSVPIRMNYDKTTNGKHEKGIVNVRKAETVGGYEDLQLINQSKKPGVKKRILRKERKHNRPVNANLSSDEEHEGKVGKSLKDVKKMGLDLMEEVRTKGRGVKAWTANKLPHLQRLYKRHRLKLGHKGRKISSSSLALVHGAVTMEDTTSVHLWVGKDYVNWISKDLNDPDEPFKDIVDRRVTPRMPWHDIGLFVEGPAARDAARHFIQRWNAIKTEKAKLRRNYPYLLPRSYKRAKFSPSPLERKHRVDCQVLRSVGPWSAGQEENESSIYFAYLELIRAAKHFIYIENQFFISSAATDGSKDLIINRIGYEIVQRIVRAHSNGDVFRVYILLPLLPAFEGMIGKSSGVAMQYIVYWNYVSISRGKMSIIEQLKEHGITEWEKYVSFCSLRTHEELESRPVSELVYIHSKMMIVDDRFVIAGSANINDRSMNGSRDSEVCLLIEDKEFESGVMNGQPYESGLFSGSMRRYLFSEHLGVADAEVPHIDVSDPVSEAFFIDIWCKTAAKNASIYEEVFSCYPCDSATTFEDVDKLRETSTLVDLNLHEARNRLKEIQGHLVKFPLDFLKDETLKPGVGNKEYLLPMEMWT